MNRVAAFVIGAGVVVGALAVSSGVAQATSGPPTDEQLVTPAVQSGANGSFYTDDQIQEVWTAVVKNYPSPLPAGYSLPAKAPQIFHEDDKRHLFQVGLPDMIAAQYWRCAWLDAALHTERATVSNDDLAKALATYKQLPSVAANDSLSAADLDSYAKANALDSSTALFNLTCEGYSK